MREVVIYLILSITLKPRHFYVRGNRRAGMKLCAVANRGSAELGAMSSQCYSPS